MSGRLKRLTKIQWVRYARCETTRAAPKPEWIMNMRSIPGLFPRQLLQRLAGIGGLHDATWHTCGIPYRFIIAIDVSVETDVVFSSREQNKKWIFHF